MSAYLAALLVGYVAAVIAQTQHVLARLSEMGAAITIGTRIDATVHDLTGLATSLLPLLAIAFAIAFAVAAGVIRLAPRWRFIGYPLAGGAALLGLHLILNQVFGISAIAASRTTAGLTVQALCGVLGGWVFGALLRRRP